MFCPCEADFYVCCFCAGHSHKDCTVLSTAELNPENEFLCICKQCYHTRSTTPNQDFNSTKVQLSLQQKQHIPLPIVNVKAPPKKKPSDINRGSASKKGTCLSNGLIWKKKNSKLDLGADFRLNNILLRGNPGMDPSRRPLCHLCNEPYNSNLMYIRCESCSGETSMSFCLCFPGISTFAMLMCTFC